MSNTSQMVLFIIIGSISVVILTILNVPQGITLALVIGASLMTFTIYPLFLIYKSNSIVAIDRYIIRNRKKPLFSYAYALAHGSYHEQEAALQLILKKYRQQHMQITYQANLALLQKDYKKVLQLADEMERPDYKPYYLGTAYSLTGQIKLAETYIEHIQTPWMLHSLKSSIALQQEDLTTYTTEMEKAIESTTGLQKYTLHHRFANQSID